MKRIKIFLIVLFIAFLLSGVFYYRHRAEFQAAAVADMHSRKLQVFYDYEVREDGSIDLKAKPNISQFLLDWFGVDYFYSVVMIDDHAEYKEFDSFPNIKKFRIDYRKDGLHHIRKLRRLEHVIADPTTVIDLPPLLASSHLKTLLCSSNQLDFIGSRANLRELRLETTESDWRGLKSLQKLEVLEIVARGKVDVAALAELKNLKQLTIDCPEFPNLLPLKNNKKLERIELFISSNEKVELNGENSSSNFDNTAERVCISIPEFIPLQLKRLSISADILEHPENLKVATGLEELALSVSQSIYLSDIFAIPNLNYAFLNTYNKHFFIDKSIGDVSDSKLQTLLLSGSVYAKRGILEKLEDDLIWSDQEPIDSQVSELEKESYFHAKMDGVKVLSLQNFPVLKNLNTLSLTKVAIDYRSTMNSFPNLKSLEINSCHFRRETAEGDTHFVRQSTALNHLLSSLSELKKLNTFLLAETPLFELDKFGLLSNLESLVLRRDQLSSFPSNGKYDPKDTMDFTPISNLKRLRNLFADFKRPKNLKFLNGMENLEGLGLRFPEDNNIDEIGSLKKLKELVLSDFIKEPFDEEIPEVFIDPVEKCKALERLYVLSPTKSTPEFLNRMPNLKVVNGQPKNETVGSMWPQQFGTNFFPSRVFDMSEDWQIRNKIDRVKEKKWELHERWDKEFELRLIQRFFGGFG